MQVTVTDDSGFLGIIDPDSYKGFVAEDWTYESLFGHFTREMQRRTLLLWATSDDGGSWTVTTEASGHAGRRSVTGPIVATRGRLCLVNYESLSMAAQFADVSLPEPHMADLLFDVEAGPLDCTVTQLHDDDTMPGPHFAISLAPSPSPATTAGGAWAHPAWYDPTTHHH